MAALRSRVVIALAMSLATVACGGSSRPSATPTAAPPTASTASPAGAMSGFLHAAGQQDNGQVLSWLATAADTTDLNELLKVYSSFGTTGGFVWEVRGLSATGERSLDATHAYVALTGPIVWCLGSSVSDPSATCSQVNGVAGLQATYVAVSVAGEWRVDVDVNASSGLSSNPQASPGGRTASPAPT